MRFTTEGFEEVRMNLDPMIDCVFLLILFFLSTTTFIKMEQDLSINLPTMSEKLKVIRPPMPPIIVNVRYLPGGEAYFHVDNEKMSPALLTLNLQRARIRYKEQAVVIRGDKNVKWDHVARVMGCCAQAGITKVSATVEVAE